MLLELTESNSLVVEVVDVDDAPVPGVPVAVRVRHGDVHHDALTATTGSDGRATFDRVDRFTPRRGAPDELACSVVTTIPLANPVEVMLDGEVGGGQPLRLRLPPTGRIVVEVDPDDPAMRELVSPVTLVAFDAAAGSAPEGLLTAESVDGRATFPIVGCGLRLKAFAKVASAELRVESEPTVGPTAAGEVAVLRLRRPRWPNHVAATAVDQEGKPIAGATLRAYQLTMANHGDGVRDGLVKTDAEGRFELALDDSLPLHRSLHEFLLRIDGAEGEEPSYGYASVEVVYDSNALELGEIKFEQGAARAVPPHGLLRTMSPEKPQASIRKR